MRVKSVFLMAVFVILQNIVVAQNDLYQFSHLDINNGLSNNQINCIFKDSYGFMWFGTTSGLNRYDGYRFRVFKNSGKDQNSINDNYVSRLAEGPGKKMWVYTHNNYCIYDPETESFTNNIDGELARLHLFTHDIGFIKKDNSGNYWFTTNNSGLYHYQSSTKTTTFYDNSHQSKLILHSKWVMDVADGGSGIFWLVYSDGVLEKVDFLHNRVLETTTLPSSAGVSGQPVSYSIKLDLKKNIWLWANSKPIGVYAYDTRSKIFKHYAKDNPAATLNSNIVYNIVIGDDHKIWLGTDHGGINIIDPETAEVTYLLPREDDPKSLMGNSVVLYKDQEGVIWAGTYKQGISYYHEGIFQFPLVRHYASDKISLPYEDVDCYQQDKNGGLWIGTNGGGLIYYDPVKHRYTSYKHDQGNPNSLSNDIIISLCIDHEGKLWIGTYFGGLDYFDGKTFRHYRHDDQVAGSIADDRVYSILEDRQYRIWVGTFAGGVNILNRKTNLFSRPYPALNSNYIGKLYADRKGNIWVGQDKGINVIDAKTNKVTSYLHNNRNANSLVANDINSIIEDSRHLMWIGTKGGLSIFNPKVTVSSTLMRMATYR